MSGGGRLQMPGLQVAPSCDVTIESVSYDGGAGETTITWSGGVSPFLVVVDGSSSESQTAIVTIAASPSSISGHRENDNWYGASGVDSYHS